MHYYYYNYHYTSTTALALTNTVVLLEEAFRAPPVLRGFQPLCRFKAPPSISLRKCKRVRSSDSQRLLKL